MYRPKEEVAVKGYIRVIEGGKLGDIAQLGDRASGLTYSVKLRPNVRFSDGAPFSSADVVFSFQAAQESAESVLASGLLDAWAGWVAVVAGVTGAASVILTGPRLAIPLARANAVFGAMPRRRAISRLLM